MNITVLHECYLGPSHIARLKKLGNVEVFSNTNTEKQAMLRLKNSHIAVIHCSLLPITKHMLESAHSLKYISLASTGFDAVDIETAKRLRIAVSNLSTYGTESVAEHTIALMLAIERHIVSLDRIYRSNPYEINFLPEKKAYSYKSSNLRGKTLGLIGTGKIGVRVSEIAHALGMRIIGYDKFPRSIPFIKQATFKKVLKESDIISLHTPLDATSKNMISTNEFASMKPNAVLINTARGGLVDEKALYMALKNHKVAGAALDTMVGINKKNPLLRLETVIFTPHAAWYSDESCGNIADTVVANIEAFLHGKPINVIV